MFVYHCLLVSVSLDLVGILYRCNSNMNALVIIVLFVEESVTRKLLVHIHVDHSSRTNMRFLSRQPLSQLQDFSSLFWKKKKESDVISSPTLYVDLHFEVAADSMDSGEAPLFQLILGLSLTKHV